MKKLLIIFLFLNIVQQTYSQDTNIVVKKKIGFKLSGFVKTDFWFDTRKTANAREEIFSVFPKDIELDALGNDINAASSFNFSVITSRLAVKIDGFDAFGAKTFGYIEADFSGISNATIATFRLRHAFLQLNWKKSSLLLGQFWHPMFVTDAFPSVISLNTGAPFQPFIRSPQIRYTQHIKNIDIIASLLAQRDYANIGPIGRSYSYMSNALIPNAHFQIKYKNKKSVFGVAVDYKILKPRQTTDSNIITDAKVSSISYMAYYNWTNKKFQIKTKAIWGQNLSDNLLLGGYAVASIDPINDERSYTPTQHLFTWLDLDYTIKLSKTKLLPGIFFGYSKNFGTLKENTGIYYATASNMADMFRIAPSLSIKSGNTMLSLEWEYTSSNYGTANNKGIIVDTHSVSNNRIIFTGFYFF